MLQSFELIEIKSLSDIPYNGTVYDLEVETDHSYNVNNIIVHNSSCITRKKTGFYRPMISTILDCSSVSIPIIADGGISEHGDIAKALSCGASMIMAGSLFAGFDESAGDIIEINDRKYKEYFGSASEYNKEQRKNIEGRKILIDYKGSMSRLLQELREDLQSSISYAGGNNLSALHPGLLIQVNN
jgi:GMP reductase